MSGLQDLAGLSPAEIEALQQFKAAGITAPALSNGGSGLNPGYSIGADGKIYWYGDGAAPADLQRAGQEYFYNFSGGLAYAGTLGRQASAGRAFTPGQGVRQETSAAAAQYAGEALAGVDGVSDGQNYAAAQDYGTATNYGPADAAPADAAPAKKLNPIVAAILAAGFFFL